MPERVLAQELELVLAQEQEPVLVREQAPVPERVLAQEPVLVRGQAQEQVLVRELAQELVSDRRQNYRMKEVPPGTDTEQRLYYIVQDLADL